MINESYYWKRELYNSFLTIADFRHSKKKNEQSFVNVEKAIMIGAFIIRKLDEAEKIPPDFLERTVSLDFLLTNGTMVDHMNWHRLETHYNFEKVTKTEKNWKFIINQLIHSFSFFFSYDDTNKLDGVLINSDKTKKGALFFLPIKELLTFFLTVSEGTITSSTSYRKATKDKDGTLKPGEMKLKEALYSYPENFNLPQSVTKTMDGEIYTREQSE